MLFQPLIFSLFILLSSSLVVFPSYGHGDHGCHGGSCDASGSSSVEANLHFLQQVTQLAPKTRRPEGVADAFMRLGGQKVYFNSTFWQLVRQAANLQLLEVAQDCPNCVLPSVEDVLVEAKTMAAQGRWSTLGKRVGGRMMRNYGKGAVEMAAPYGPGIGVFWVVMELAEEAMLILFKSPGAHVLCNVITATLTAGARLVQTTTRAFSFSRKHWETGVCSPLAIAYLARRLRRAQEKVVFSSPPLDLSDSEASHLEAELGIDTPHTHTSLDVSKRQRFVTWLKSRLAAIDQKIRRLQDEQPLGVWNRQKLKRLENQREKLQTLRRKIFEGRRYKRFFLLFSRKGHRKSLATDEGFGSRLRGRFLWVLAAEVGTFDPYMHHPRDILEKNSEGAESQTLVSRAIQPDPIRHEIATSFVADHGQSDPAYVAEVLNDISLVFDPSVSKAQKYLFVRSLEVVVGSLLVATSRRVNDDIWEWAVAKEDLSGWSKFRSDLRFWWRRGVLTRYFHRYFDFLRVVSVSGNWPDRYWLQYEAMEYFLDMMRVLQNLESFRSVGAEESPTQALLTELQQRREKLHNNQFWIPKRRHFNWVPLRKSPPRCEQLGAL